MPIENAIQTLKGICPRVIQQGSLPQNEAYPARFFTFWNGETHDHKHYDNAARGVVWTLDINFYSTDPLDIYSTIPQAIEALRAEGWIISGMGHAVASDYNTHTGRGFTALYIDPEKEETA